MCLHVCFSFCRTDSLNKAALGCVSVPAEDATETNRPPRGNKWKRGEAANSLRGGCEGCRGTRWGMWVCTAWRRVALAEAGWWVAGCGWCIRVLAGWPGFLAELSYCQEFAIHEQQSGSQLSFFIIYWSLHFYLKLKKTAIRCFLYQQSVLLSFPRLLCVHYSLNESCSCVVQCCCTHWQMLLDLWRVKRQPYTIVA